MVSTRRKTASTVPDAPEPEPQPQPATVPQRGRRVAADAQPQDSEAGAVPTPASVPAPSHVPTSGEATTSEHDRVWLNRYREMVQKEKDDASRTIFTRTARRLKLAWHHYRISMAPFMLDPWEQALYIVGILLIALAFTHALQRTYNLASPALSSVLNGWAPAANGNHANHS